MTRLRSWTTSPVKAFQHKSLNTKKEGQHREENPIHLQDDYFAAYRSLKLTRDAGGVLVVEFHTKGGPFRFTAQGYTELVDAFYRIAQDREKDGHSDRIRGEFIRPDGPEGPLKDLARSESYFRQGQLLSHHGSWSFLPTGECDCWSSEQAANAESTQKTGAPGAGARAPAGGARAKHEGGKGRCNDEKGIPACTAC